MANPQEKVREDIDKIVKDLKIEGVDHTAAPDELIGLGDKIEEILTKHGITQERFKELFGLQECNCTERKKFLNGLFSWYRKRKDDERVGK